MTTSFIINHLWQSSCFALLAGLLAFVLRKNSPKVRYWVWLSASLKFLIPFALLVGLGGVVPRPTRRPVSVAAPVFPNALVQIAQPFSPTLKPTVSVHTQSIGRRSRSVSCGSSGFWQSCWHDAAVGWDFEQHFESARPSNSRFPYRH